MDGSLQRQLANVCWQTNPENDRTRIGDKRRVLRVIRDLSFGALSSPAAKLYRAQPVSKQSAIVEDSSQKIGWCREGDRRVRVGVSLGSCFFLRCSTGIFHREGRFDCQRVPAKHSRCQRYGWLPVTVGDRQLHHRHAEKRWLRLLGR